MHPQLKLTPSSLLRSVIAVSFVLSASAAQARSAPARIEGTDLLSGKPAALAFADAKAATAVVFLSSRCPCSSSHEARLGALATEFRTRGVRFIGIHSNQDEPETEALTHFQAAHLPFPVVQDPGAKLANAFGAVKTPHVYLVNPQGEVLFQGGVDDSHNAGEAHKFYLKTALDQLAGGKRPDPSEVRVLGCMIKR